MIRSITLNKDIPVQVETKIYSISDIRDGFFYRYLVKDNKIPVGYVDLQDTSRGCYVMYIKNQNPELYKGFGKIADQLEVEHCLNKGISSPYIESNAMVGTLIHHYKRGKRYIDEAINVYLNHIISGLKKGERVDIASLGKQKMYMPHEMLMDIMEKIKMNPLLKK